MTKFNKIEPDAVEREKIRTADRERTAIMMKERAEEKARISQEIDMPNTVELSDKKSQYIMNNWGKRKSDRFDELSEKMNKENAFYNVEYYKGSEIV